MIHLIVLGKLKETYWQEAEGEYLKRLKPYAKIQIHELREEGFTEKSVPEMIKEKEAEKILATMEKISDSYNIVLDEHGKQFSSTEFTQQISHTTIQPFSNLTFIIGGPLGLHGKILEKCQLKLGLSKLTFTHQMARVFLLEQIYRAMMITNNRKYHY